MKRLLLSVCLLSSANFLNAQTFERGGTNYFYFEWPGTPCTATNSELPEYVQYGVILDYDNPTYQSTIQQQLQAMYNSGQTKIKLPIFFADSTYNGTSLGITVDSYGGNLTTATAQGLTDLLAEIKAIGFTQLEVGFYAQGTNNPLDSRYFIDGATWNAPGQPAGWSFNNAQDEQMWFENFNFIVNVRQILVNSGLFYRIDLQPEGVPATQYGSGKYSTLLAYDQMLWAYYVYLYGVGDTAGMSIAGGCLGGGYGDDICGSTPWDTLAQLPMIYGSGNPYGDIGYPYFFDFHIYNDAYNEITYAHNYLTNTLGLTQGWILGEAFYNDDASPDPNGPEPQQIINAVNATGQTIFYVNQFPTSENSLVQSPCGGVPDVQPNVSTGFAFNNWIAKGF